jgi:hypothetical protein
MMFRMLWGCGGLFLCCVEVEMENIHFQVENVYVVVWRGKLLMMVVIVFVVLLVFIVGVGTILDVSCVVLDVE